MRIVSAEELSQILDYGALVDAIADAFRAGCEMPVRHHHTVATDGADGTLLLMPAWRVGGFIGVKVVTIFPDNGARGLPAVMGNYFLMDANSGAPVALLDGQELTVRRTASASALAARYLARKDSHRLLMVGTGAMAPHLVHAHATVRPITEVMVWGRNPEKAGALAEWLDESRLSVRQAPDLEAAVAEADVISCATLAVEPLVRGAWLRPGQHLDLVGAFTPEMRETDDDAVRRARVYVDTREGALVEGGDVVRPIRDGVISAEDVQGDLYQLSRGEVAGRGDAQEITLFKSTGAALEDLAAAELAHRRLATP
ncbi:MAG: ornithine cyclodeaminase family protein [Alphaproteobacteria bacterium]|nr:ornithine cyclodeaminase family protein [Alphaproteobacteria bacterium]